MLQGYIIEKFNHMGNFYTSPRLAEEAAKIGMKLRVVGVLDTCFFGGALYNDGSRLKSTDIVINRYKWGHLKDSINNLADRSYNEIGHFRQFVNKFSQLQVIKSDEFLIPDYILGTSVMHYEMLTDALGGPFVAKGLESSMGREIFLINKKEDMDALKTLGEDKEWLFEQFIASSFGRDLRIFSVRGEALCAMIRSSQSDFRANVALGAGTKAYPVDDTIRKIARDIYRQTKLDFVGIDLLFGEHGYYFCEINVMPGIEGIETACGVNVAGAIVSAIASDFR